MLKKTFTAMAFGLAAGLAAAAPAGAVTFATYSPTSPTANISLSGLALTAKSTVRFDFLDAALAPLGDLSAVLTVNATETGAVAFGPIALGSFDGTFSLIYTGATKTAGGYTVHTGDDLLSGTFLGSVFTGYGTSGSLNDSVLAGGLVSYDNNSFLTFNSLADQGLSLGMTSITPAVSVDQGQLTDFSAVSHGSFSAEEDPTGGIPEPATWAIMLLGFGVTGASLRARRRRAPIGA